MSVRSRGYPWVWSLPLPVHVEALMALYRFLFAPVLLVAAVVAGPRPGAPHAPHAPSAPRAVVAPAPASEARPVPAAFAPVRDIRQVQGDRRILRASSRDGE